MTTPTRFLASARSHRAIAKCWSMVRHYNGIIRESRPAVQETFAEFVEAGAYRIYRVLGFLRGPRRGARASLDVARSRQLSGIAAGAIAHSGSRFLIEQPQVSSSSRNALLTTSTGADSDSENRVPVHCVEDGPMA
jgi:hypothetical protein